MGDLEYELTNLLNSFSAENDSNTPDYILAKFMLDCLRAFNVAISLRTLWYASIVEDKGE